MLYFCVLFLSTDSDENSHHELNNVNSSSVMPPAKYVRIFIIIILYVVHNIFLK